ncbi:MAG: PqiC family protein [Gammaproteobacteria bacterium]
MNRSVLMICKCCTVISLLYLLTGCMGGGAGPVRYYLIDPVPVGESRTSADESLAVEILDLHVPQYLDRFHIATRRGENRLAFSDQHQWGESLRKNLMRTLARNLSQQLNTADVATPLNRSSSRADVRVQVYIDQFELDVDGLVKLAARWQLTDGNSNEPLAIQSADLTGDAVVSSNDYTAMVADMRNLFGRLSRLIAESIGERAAGED